MPIGPTLTRQPRSTERRTKGQSGAVIDIRDWCKSSGFGAWRNAERAEFRSQDLGA